MSESQLSRVSQGYDSTEVEVFRWSADRAVVVVDSQIMAIVASEARHLPDFQHKAVVEGWLQSDPRAIGSASLGRLLTWASKRSPRNELEPGGDDFAFMLARETYDWQLVHDTPFNRRLIREALQTLVELDYDADIRVLLELTRDHRGNAQLRMTVGDLKIYVMSGRPEVSIECGNEPMPGAWEASP